MHSPYLLDFLFSNKTLMMMMTCAVLASDRG